MEQLLRSEREAADEDAPGLGPRAFRRTFLALLALSALTFGLSFLHLGALEVPAALAIASLKATLVVLFFMHLWEQPRGNAAALALAVFLTATLVALVAADVATRDPGQGPGSRGGLSRDPEHD